MGERKDLRDLLRDADFTQKRIIDDLANSSSEPVEERDVAREIKRSEGGDFIKNFFVGLLLIGIVVGSFWVSFLIGKKILVPPVKNLPSLEVPVPRAISKTDMEQAASVDEEPILPEREVKEIETKAAIPRPIVIAKKPVSDVQPATLARSMPVSKSTSGAIYYKVIVGVANTQQEAIRFNADLKAK